jgi:HD-GYP domain-containing protein (c-di-GMP phosphodiesterase class II)
MGTDQLLPVELDQLELGLPLRYNVFAENGKLLASAGEKFTEVLKAKWSDLGISTIRVQLADVPSRDISLLRPYDPAALQRLEANLELAKAAAFTLASRLTDQQAVNSVEFQQLAALLLKDIHEDCSVALLSLFKDPRKPLTANDQMLSERCSQLSLLSMVIASELGWEESVCRLTGMAGLLHDVSMIQIASNLSTDDQQDHYIQHSLKSAYMVEKILGIDARVCMAIAQVHESLLGDGFPRGLNGNRILPTARVIHLADTYLTLTASEQPKLFPNGRNLHPADGLGYIMYHAAKGRFEVEMVKALVSATSLYPIGSSVKLSDETSAVVFRSSKVAPSLPVVQLSDQRLVDLRYSNLSILGPSRDPELNYRELLKSQMEDVMWI